MLPSSLSSKIKGMLFADRRPGGIIRPSAANSRPEDSQTNLVNEIAGPSISEITSSEDVAATTHKTGDTTFSSKSRRHNGNGKKKKSATRSYSDRSIDKRQESPPRRHGSVKSNQSACQDVTSDVIKSKRPRRGLRQHELLKEHRKVHNSSQQVHVLETAQDGTSQLEPVRHYMRSSSNTPLRKTAAGRFNSIGADKDMRILLNVGGVRHETHVTTLSHIPYSRLSKLAEYHLNSGRGKQEYFFDRHPAVFNSIIDFYRTGELHVPLEVCGAVVKRELDFWQIDELGTKACCWRHYRSYIENQHILASFKHSLDREAMIADLSGLSGWKLWQTRIWYIMDHPRTSRMAMAYGITSFLFVTASIAGFCLETLPQFQPQAVNTSATCNGQAKQTIAVVMSSDVGLHVLDFICTVFFTLELVLRFVVSPAKVKFVLNPMNLIDLLALVPLYVQVIFEQSELQACYMNERFVIRVMFILRIFRMFRIFHLVKHYQALKVLVYALKASLQELMMLFIFLLLAMLIFSTMIYYAERGDEEKTQLQTIPIGFWWAIITMTMVGYGDVVPRTPVGYVVGTACSVVGVLLFALTFPIIANNFTLFYTHVRSRSISPPRAKDDDDDDEEEGGGGGDGRGGGEGGWAGRMDADVTVYEAGAHTLPEPIEVGQGITMRQIDHGGRGQFVNTPNTPTTPTTTAVASAATASSVAAATAALTTTTSAIGALAANLARHSRATAVSSIMNGKPRKSPSSDEVASRDLPTMAMTARPRNLMTSAESPLAQRGSDVSSYASMSDRNAGMQEQTTEDGSTMEMV